MFDPLYAGLRLRDGTVIVKLLKAMYGCIQSALLLYNDIKRSLEGMGIAANPYDQCVFNKGVGSEQCTVCVYVDDLLITGVEETLLGSVVDAIAGVYGTGSSHSCIDMTFDFGKVDGCVQVSQVGYIDDVLRHASTVLQYKTYCSPDTASCLRHAQTPQPSRTRKERCSIR